MPAEGGSASDTRSAAVAGEPWLRLRQGREKTGGKETETETETETEAGEERMSARSVLDALAARTEPDRAEEAALPPPPPLQKEEDREAERGLPMAVSRQDFSTVACPKSPGSPSLAALLAESRAARHSLTEALSPRSRRRAEKAAASPPAFDLNAVAGALKQVEAETDRGRGPVRPRQASMPITPVSEEYAAEATAAGGDAAFALSPPKGPATPPSLPEPIVDRASVEPECVAPIARPRRGSRKAAAGRASAIWSRREVEAEADAEQELALLRQQRA